MIFFRTMILSFLCFLLIACPNQGGGPVGEPVDSTFQEKATPLHNDGGHEDGTSASGSEDAGADDDPIAPETTDAGAQSDIRPPARDSGTSERRCNVSDLIYTAEPRDGNGPCSDACDSSTIEFVGKVLNPCDHGIEFTTNNTCLVTQWEWSRSDQTDASERLSPMCGAAITTHRLEARSLKEQSSRQITGFSAGSWELKITFSSFSSGNAISVSPTGAEASVTFSSQ